MTVTINRKKPKPEKLPIEYIRVDFAAGGVNNKDHMLLCCGSSDMEIELIGGSVILNKEDAIKLGKALIEFGNQNEST